MYREVGRLPSAPTLPKCALGASDLAATPHLRARYIHYLHQDPQPGPRLLQ